MVMEEGLQSLLRQCIELEEQAIPGAFVECGVWKGGAAGLMALANLRYGSTRRHIHLFDSFEEICEPDEKLDGDRAIKEAREWAGCESKGRLNAMKGFYDHVGGPGSLEECRILIEEKVGYPSSHVHYHKGWFQQTLPEWHCEDDRIALLRLDADWYASTKVCLEHLFDRVHSGGIIIIDDYGTYDGCRKAVDEFLEARGLSYKLHVISADIRCIRVH